VHLEFCSETSIAVRFVMMMASYILLLPILRCILRQWKRCWCMGAKTVWSPGSKSI